MQDWLVKLHFRAPAHFGEAGIEQETTASWVHSDTLWSALCAVWARYDLAPAIGSVIERCRSTAPPFWLTSAFPFHRETCFLPKPLGIKAKGLDGEPKLAKKTKFLSTDLFDAWVQGQPIDPEVLKASSSDYSDSFRIHLRPRVVIDRVTNRSNIFHSGLVYFRPNAGLWFLLRLEDPALLTPLKEAVSLLGDEGLGGDRSTGAGRFKATWLQVTEEASWRKRLDCRGDEDGYCLLSLYSPNGSEAGTVTGKAVIDVVERKGWAQGQTGAQGFRNVVRMVVEGSVLDACPIGRIVDVTPDGWADKIGHAIYRNGLAVAVPVRRGEGSA